MIINHNKKEEGGRELNSNININIFRVNKNFSKTQVIANSDM